jgi:hypothetical protein
MGALSRPGLPENALRAFLTTATTGSYAETDRIHGWTATSAYRRCSELETILGHHLDVTSTALLRQNQRTRRLETTALGAALIPLARARLNSNETFWEVLEVFATSSAHQNRRPDRGRGRVQPPHSSVP